MRIRIFPVLMFLLLGVAQAFAASQVIVKLESNADIRDVSKFMHGRVLDQIPHQRLFLVEVPSRLPAAARFLGVHSWEPNRVVKKLNSVNGLILSAPNSLPDWYKDQPALTRIGRPAAQLMSTGRGVVIADINSGVDFSHPSLVGAFTSGYDFILSRPYDVSIASLNQSDVAFLDQSDVAFLDQSDVAFLDAAMSAMSMDAATQTFLTGAGVTAVSGSTIGPQVNQAAYSHATLCIGMIHSIAPDSMIMPLRAFDDSGNTDLFTLAKAIDFAITHSAQVINMSFGLDSPSDSILTEIQTAQAAGITVVASAGNANTPVAQYPAAYSGVLAIASVDNSDLKARFSNFGSYVTASAPGLNVITSFPGGYYAVVSGTSFSAPIVAAEAALLRAVQKNAATAIVQSSVNIDALNMNYSGGLGAGRVNLSQALAGQSLSQTLVGP